MKRTINNSVSLLYEAHRKLPWLVRRWGLPDAKTGKQKRYSRAFLHRREAKAYQAEKLAELNRGVRRDPVLITLEELIKEFAKTRLSQLSYASQISYKNTTEQMLEWFGPKKKIVDIEPRHAEAFIASRKRCDGRDGQLSSWSRARHLVHARAVLASAVAWDWLAANPFRGVRPFNPRGRAWHHLTPQEFARLQAVVPSARTRALYWLLYSGLRVGEGINLRVCDIDLARRRVHIVNREATADIPPFTVKADRQSGEGKERWVPIPEAAITDVSEAVKEAFKSGGFVALSPERFAKVQEHWRLCRAGEPWGGHAWRPWQNRDLLNNLLRDTKRYLRRAKIELTAPFTLTTFRKSHCQNLANAGVPPRTLARLLGHSDSRMTLRHYCASSDASERQATEIMNRLFAVESDSAPQRMQS